MRCWRSAGEVGQHAVVEPREQVGEGAALVALGPAKKLELLLHVLACADVRLVHLKTPNEERPVLAVTSDFAPEGKKVRRFSRRTVVFQIPRRETFFRDRARAGLMLPRPR